MVIPPANITNVTISPPQYHTFPASGGTHTVTYNLTGTNLDQLATSGSVVLRNWFLGQIGSLPTWLSIAENGVERSADGAQLRVTFTAVNNTGDRRIVVFNFYGGGLPHGHNQFTFQQDAFVPPPPISFSPPVVTIDNGNLTQTVTVGGTATGVLILRDLSNLPDGVTAEVSGDEIIVRGVRPTTNVPAIYGSFYITVGRIAGGGSHSSPLTINVNLTTTWRRVNNDDAGWVAQTPMPMPTPSAMMPGYDLPGVRVVPSEGLIELLSGDFDEMVAVETSRPSVAGGFVTLDVALDIDDDVLRQPGAYFTIFAELGDFVEDLMKVHRIVAVLDGRVIGGAFDAESGDFAVSTADLGEFTIVYVQNLRRLTMSPDSALIADLAGNAQAQTMDVLPIVQNGQTLVPIRFIAQALGATVYWSSDADGRVVLVHISMGGRTVDILIDGATQIVDGRTMVPLRMVSEALGATVIWDEATRSIEIISIGNAGDNASQTGVETHMYRRDEDENEIEE